MKTYTLYVRQAYEYRKVATVRCESKFKALNAFKKIERRILSFWRVETDSATCYWLTESNGIRCYRCVIKKEKANDQELEHAKYKHAQTYGR